MRPIFEITIERKNVDKAEPAELAAGSKMKMDTVSSPPTETQKREPGDSSIRMENFVKIKPRGQVPDSEKKKTEMKTIKSSLTEAPKSGLNSQERKDVDKAESAELAAASKMKMDTISSPLTETQKREPGGSSTRMENFVKIEPHGQVPDSEKKRTEIKTINSSLTEAQEPKSGPNLQKR